VEAVQHKVREVIKYGADVIKICATGGVLSKGDDPNASQYTLEEMKAIVADAHRLGRKVAAHAHGAEGVRWASEAGVDSVEHGHLMDDAAIATLKKNGTYLVPTLFLTEYMQQNMERSDVPEFSKQKMRWMDQAGRHTRTRQVGGHDRGRRRSHEGCHDARAREVCDEGRRRLQERLRQTVIVTKR
jgi:imidazolonepropionase-like amidohydrolase